MKSKLKWEGDLLQAVKKSLEIVPVPFRERALKAIIEGGEAAAVERGSQIVEKGDLLAGIKKNVPKNMIGFCLKSLKRQGVELDILEASE
jgi:hypothetical protein